MLLYLKSVLSFQSRHSAVYSIFRHSSFLYFIFYPNVDVGKTYAVHTTICFISYYLSCVFILSSWVFIFCFFYPCNNICYNNTTFYPFDLMENNLRNHKMTLVFLSDYSLVLSLFVTNITSSISVILALGCFISCIAIYFFLS